jgi:hypothetical protein
MSIYKSAQVVEFESYKFSKISDDSAKYQVSEDIQQGVLCTPINFSKVVIDTAIGKAQAFLLKLETESGEIINKFFNVTKTQKGNYTVGHNSDFAKLYRLTTGENPTARFSRADRLLKHLLGYEFVCEYDQSAWTDGTECLKVRNIRPLNPVQNNEWTITGNLKQKIKVKTRKTHKISNVKMAMECQKNDNNLATDWQCFGNDKSLEAAKTLGLEHDFDFSVSVQQYDGIKPYHSNKDNNIYTHTREDENLIDAEYSVTENKPKSNTQKIIKSETETLFVYQQMQDETIDDYFDRVLDESLDWL